MGLFAPPGFSPFVASAPSDFPSFIGMLGTIFIERQAMFLDVFGLASKHNQIFGTVICLDAVNVMNALAGIKRAAQLLFGHETMFIDIAVTIGLGMVRGVSVYISALVNPSPALPVASFGAAFVPVFMARTVQQVVACIVSATRTCLFDNRRSLSAAAFAEAGRVRRLMVLSEPFLIHLFGGIASGPVALYPLLTRAGRLSTTTST